MRGWDDITSANLLLWARLLVSFLYIILMTCLIQVPGPNWQNHMTFPPTSSCSQSWQEWPFKMPSQLSIQASNSPSISTMAIVQAHRARFKDPAGDTDEDLSKVPEDFNRPKGTKKLGRQLKDHWALSVSLVLRQWKNVERAIRLTESASYCLAKVKGPMAHSKWGNPKEALCQASPDDMYRFLNWCFKFQFNPNGHRLKGYNKFSALEEDWKYSESTTSRSLGMRWTRWARPFTTCILPNRTQCHSSGESHLIWIDRVYCTWLTSTAWINSCVRMFQFYIEDMVPFNWTILQTRERQEDDNEEEIR
jgi:hypothetical protein